jgi:hypothetical protein
VPKNLFTTKAQRHQEQPEEFLAEKFEIYFFVSLGDLVVKIFGFLVLGSVHNS